MMDRPTPADARPRVLGVLLILSAVLVNGAFTGLSGTFDYPHVLQRPAVQVLQHFHESPGSGLLIGALFTVLAAGAALLAPIAVAAARLAGPGRWSCASLLTGAAAAGVQVVGLLRWPLTTPALAATAADPSASAEQVASAADRYALLGTVLGRVVGETGGYLLTAAFTVSLLMALRRRFVLPRARTGLAVVSVPMILAGLLVPFEVPGAALTNFAGYVLWSVWTVTLGVRLLRTGTPGPTRSDRDIADADAAVAGTASTIPTTSGTTLDPCGSTVPTGSLGVVVP